MFMKNPWGVSPWENSRHLLFLFNIICTFLWICSKLVIFIFIEFHKLMSSRIVNRWEISTLLDAIVRLMLIYLFILRRLSWKVRVNTITYAKISWGIFFIDLLKWNWVHFMIIIVTIPKGLVVRWIAVSCIWNH